MPETLPTIDLAPDDAWSLLSNVRRRRTLIVVDEADGRVHVNDIAKAIAAYENNLDIDDLTHQQWERVYVTLIQNHFSKLSQAGAVDYDVDEKTVAAIPMTADLVAWARALNTACDADDDFPPARCDGRGSGPFVTDD